MIDFADLTSSKMTRRPQRGRVTVVACYRCHRPLHYRPADRTYFANALDATLSSAEAANRKPITRCPQCAQELYRRNLVN
jgi:hypothetical protein